MSECKSPARSFSTAEGSSASSASDTPTKESLAWFRFRQAQWKGSPRRQIQPLPPPLPTYTPPKYVTKKRPVTASTSSSPSSSSSPTSTSSSTTSVRQQPISQPPPIKNINVIPTASFTPDPHSPASFPSAGAAFARTTTRQSMVPTSTTATATKQRDCGEILPDVAEIRASRLQNDGATEKHQQQSGTGAISTTSTANTIASTASPFGFDLSQGSSSGGLFSASQSPFSTNTEELSTSIFGHQIQNESALSAVSASGNSCVGKTHFSFGEIGSGTSAASKSPFSSFSQRTKSLDSMASNEADAPNVSGKGAPTVSMASLTFSTETASIAFGAGGGGPNTASFPFGGIGSGAVAVNKSPFSSFSPLAKPLEQAKDNMLGSEVDASKASCQETPTVLMPSLAVSTVNTPIPFGALECRSTGTARYSFGGIRSGTSAASKSPFSTLSHGMKSLEGDKDTSKPWSEADATKANSTETPTAFTSSLAVMTDNTPIAFGASGGGGSATAPFSVGGAGLGTSDSSKSTVSRLSPVPKALKQAKDSMVSNGADAPKASGKETSTAAMSSSAVSTKSTPLAFDASGDSGTPLSFGEAGPGTSATNKCPFSSSSQSTKPFDQPKNRVSSSESNLPTLPLSISSSVPSDGRNSSSQLPVVKDLPLIIRRQTKQRFSVFTAQKFLWWASLAIMIGSCLIGIGRSTIRQQQEQQHSFLEQIGIGRSRIRQQQEQQHSLLEEETKEKESLRLLDVKDNALEQEMKPSAMRFLKHVKTNLVQGLQDSTFTSIASQFAARDSSSTITRSTENSDNSMHTVNEEVVVSVESTSTDTSNSSHESETTMKVEQRNQQQMKRTWWQNIPTTLPPNHI